MENLHKGLNSRTVGLLAENGMGVHYEWKKFGEEDPGFWMWVIRNRHGHYVGNVRSAKFYASQGIEPETPATPEQLAENPNMTCCIGKSAKDGKWYGWSHRAIHGFAVGDEVKEGDCCAMSGWTEEYLAEHPEEDTSLPVGFVAKTEGDCQKMAVAFAEAVG